MQHRTHSRITRRGTTLAAAALMAVASAACASTKKPAQEDSQAARPDVAQQGPGGGDRGGRGGGPGRMFDRLFEGITLSDAQRAKVDSIRASYRDRMMAARDSGGDRSRMRQMMDEQRTAIRAALTPEQQATFDANWERMRSERGRRGPGDRAGGPGGGAGR